MSRALCLLAQNLLDSAWQNIAWTCFPALTALMQCCCTKTVPNPSIQNSWFISVDTISLTYSAMLSTDNVKHFSVDTIASPGYGFTINVKEILTPFCCISFAQCVHRLSSGDANRNIMLFSRAKWLGTETNTLEGNSIHLRLSVKVMSRLFSFLLSGWIEKTLSNYL